ncbi:MAG: histidine kinase dimerization/phospho-acceptor domain-containing protein, partial [candidate division Zixibacteria bacterium]|nr:histidine kinase dimerization/phospho-acceptor domain-containing protein [candidate division Zixibacteria bacterium]
MKLDIFDNPHSCFSPGEVGQESCWLKFLASGERAEFLFPSDKKLGNCLGCRVFLEFSSRLVGRRIADRIAEESLKSLIEQVTTYDSQLEKIYTDLKKKLEELSLLKKVSDVLLQSKDLNKTLRIILTGVTAGEVFGFNRAFIFLVNQKTQSLDGREGLGPKDEEEALRIWSKIKQDKITFEQMLENVLLSEEEENELTVRVKGLSFSLQEKENILVKAVLERKSYNLKSEELLGLNPREVLNLFSSTGFMLIPILSENIPLGLLAVDNLITKNEILEEDRIGLETFANQAAYQIENILLLQELKQRQKELELATKLLRENQSYLLQTERWVDIGKIATTVAHEIKTPLVAIGGYAHRALKQAEQGKLCSHELEVIVKETERLERITSEILDYSKPTKLSYEKKDLNQLIRDALEVLKDKLKYNGVKLRTR